MGWNGSGTFQRTNGSYSGATVWQDDQNAGYSITASRVDTHDQDIAQGVNNCLAKDGQNSATGNLNLGNNRITSLASATARTDAAQAAQVQDGSFIWLGTTGGTATAMTASATPAITSYTAGQKFRAILGTSSTGTTPTAHTININGLGAKNIVHNGSGGNPTLGSWVTGRIIELVFDGTKYVITNDSGAWQSYTPATRYGTTAVTNTVQYAKYKRTENVMHVQFYLQISALAGGSGDINVDLPVNVLNYSIRSIGNGYFFDTAPGVTYVCSTVISNGNSDRVYFVNDASGASFLGTAPAITMNTGDGLLFDLHYEV